MMSNCLKTGMSSVSTSDSCSLTNNANVDVEIDYYFCFICYERYDKVVLKSAEAENVFRVLCKYLRIENARNGLDVDVDLSSDFPLCESCSDFALDIVKLHLQLETIRRKIHRKVEEVIESIIESELIWKEKILRTRDSQPQETKYSRRADIFRKQVIKSCDNDDHSLLGTIKEDGGMYGGDSYVFKKFKIQNELGSNVPENNVKLVIHDGVDNDSTPSSKPLFTQDNQAVLSPIENKTENICSASNSKTPGNDTSDSEMSKTSCLQLKTSAAILGEPENLAADVTVEVRSLPSHEESIPICSTMESVKESNEATISGAAVQSTSNDLSCHHIVKEDGNEERIVKVKDAEEINVISEPVPMAVVPNEIENPEKKVTKTGLEMPTKTLKNTERKNVFQNVRMIFLGKGKNRIKCSVCKYISHTKKGKLAINEMKEHIMTLHSAASNDSHDKDKNVPENNFTCQHCSLTCNSSFGLKIHLARKHKLSTQVSVNSSSETTIISQQVLADTISMVQAPIPSQMKPRPVENQKVESYHPPGRPIRLKSFPDKSYSSQSYAPTYRKCDTEGSEITQSGSTDHSATSLHHIAKRTIKPPKRYENIHNNATTLSSLQRDEISSGKKDPLNSEISSSNMFDGEGKVNSSKISKNSAGKTSTTHTDTSSQNYSFDDHKHDPNIPSNPVPITNYNSSLTNEKRRVGRPKKSSNSCIDTSVTHNEERTPSNDAVDKKCDPNFLNIPPATTNNLKSLSKGKRKVGRPKKSKKAKKSRMSQCYESKDRKCDPDAPGIPISNSTDNATSIAEVVKRKVGRPRVRPLTPTENGDAAIKDISNNITTDTSGKTLLNNNNKESCPAPYIVLDLVARSDSEESDDNPEPFYDKSSKKYDPLCVDENPVMNEKIPLKSDNLATTEESHGLPENGPVRIDIDLTESDNKDVIEIEDDENDDKFPVVTSIISLAPQQSLQHYLVGPHIIQKLSPFPIAPNHGITGYTPVVNTKSTSPIKKLIVNSSSPPGCVIPDGTGFINIGSLASIMQNPEANFSPPKNRLNSIQDLKVIEIVRNTSAGADPVAVLSNISSKLQCGSCGYTNQVEYVTHAAALKAIKIHIYQKHFFNGQGN